ncbi:MAG: pyruvate dehydrogenase complex dihydrolipoamide acetyltransferase [Opitutales bacterium]|nr:pyruvate dehydrogenase complex dihydrolipoamide acetyltransferase [Opitutales bacterium]
MAEIIEMPKLSDTMSTGTLIKWLKKEGDKVAAGDMIAEVETDKATMEVENFEDGVLLKIYAQEGASVPVGGPICAVGEKGEDAPEVDAPDSGDSGSDKDESSKDEEKEEKDEDESKSKGKAEKSQPKKEESDESDESDKSDDSEKSDSSGDDDSGERIKASPLARRMAKDQGLDLSAIKGTGPNGRVIKNDVLKAVEAGTAKKGSASKDSSSAAPAAASAGTAVAGLEDKEIKVSNMRAAIARALVSSKTEAPHFYLQIEVDGAPLAKLRKTLNDKLAGLAPEQGGVKFTVNDLILKAAAEAVRRVPAINRSWKGDKIVQYGQVHLAFGVAVDDGLLTPVIRQADGKGLRQIAAEAKDLIGKARGKKLKPDEMSGSTLTVTNLGMFGISDFYGIINPPNAAILSVGATVKQPVVNEKDEITIGYRMKIGLSGDHRVIDGAVGAQYLSALKEILENPALMLV